MAEQIGKTVSIMVTPPSNTIIKKMAAEIMSSGAGEESDVDEAPPENYQRARAKSHHDIRVTITPPGPGDLGRRRSSVKLTYTPGTPPGARSKKLPVVKRSNTWCIASGTSAVAIDNKIEQAMDLVKSHLMFAVREEVEVLKEKIAELMDKINQLEVENTILKAHASQETLSQLTTQVSQKAPQPPSNNAA